jgi:hypothetical protein
VSEEDPANIAVAFVATTDGKLDFPGSRSLTAYPMSDGVSVF